MAMFRTTEENLFNNLPGNYSDTLLQDYYEGQEDKFRSNLKHFSFNLNSIQKKYLVDLGISLSPLQTESHPHPVSKTIENWIIYRCLPNLLSNSGNLVLMSIKESKAKYIFNRLGDNIKNSAIINKIFEVKDCTRYSKQSIIHHGHLDFQGFLSNVKRRLGNTGPDSTFFFHDEIHHWSLDCFKDFLVAVEPNCVIFTSVFPVELLSGLDHSMNSIAYSFEVNGDDLFFFPDGKGSEPYIQNKNNSWPFYTSKIKLNYKNKKKSLVFKTGCSSVGETTYTISKVNSYGAHHVFVCARGDYSTESHRFFRDFDVANPKLFNEIFVANGRILGCKPIMRKWMLEKIVSYLVCLKKPDVESALAKLRQLSDFELNLSEINVVSMISQLLTKYGVAEEVTLLDFLRHPLTSSLGQLDCINGSVRYLLNNQEFALRLLTDKILTSDLSFEVRVKTEVKEFEVLSVSNSVVRDQEPSLNSGIWGGLQDDKLRSSKRRSVLFRSAQPPQNKASSPLEVTQTNNSQKVTESSEATSSANRAEDKSESTSSPAQVTEIKDVRNERDGSDSAESSSRKKNDCFLKSISKELNIDLPKLFFKVCNDLKECEHGFETLVKLQDDIALTFKDIETICLTQGWRVHIHMGSEIKIFNDSHDLRVINIGGRPGHVFNLVRKENGCDALFKLLKKAQSSTFGYEFESGSFDVGGNNRASTLIKAFSSMNFGALIDRSKMNQGKVLPRACLDWHRQGEEIFNTLLSKVKANTLPFLGFAGSGKTHALLEVLLDANMPGSFVFISSRKEVIDQIKRRVRERRETERTSLENCFKTFEAALLMEQIPELVILDECALLPPGFSDLLALKLVTSRCLSLFSKSGSSFDAFVKLFCKVEPMNFKIAYTGDHLQSTFFSESFAPLNGIPNELVYLNSKFDTSECPYLFGTKRFGEPTSDFIKLPFYGQGSCDVLLLKSIDSLGLERYKKQIEEKKLVALVASHADKRFISNQYIQSMTFGESQGSTFDYVMLYLTPDFLKVSTESCIVALTRHRKGLFIILEDDFHADFSTPRAQMKEISGILRKDFGFVNEYIEKKLTAFHVVCEPTFGHDFEIKLAGDPFLKSELSLLKEIEVPDLLIAEPSVPKSHLKVHIPIAEDGILTREISEKMKAREEREFLGFGRGVSEQFKESFGKFEKNKSSQAWAAEAIFPRHKNSDSNTFWAACKKRLVFSNPRKNIDDLRRNRSVGVEMLKVFLKYVHLDNSLEPNLWQQCIHEFEEKKISKDAATLANHHVRSLKDWKDNEIFLFIKNQLCTKSEKMFTEAKAGQTLACFSHSLLIKFAPLSRYIEHKVSNALDKRFYIHQKKNFDVLNEWVKSRGFDGLCTESDYEAFDRSQDSMTLAFEIELMKFLGIDAGLIEDYIWLKCHLDCKLGTLAIMRFTGEFGTFLFNTLTNMVFTFMRYDIKKDVSICFAGDDMCANRPLRKRDSYNHILDKMTLKAKVAITDKPMFCGWFLSRYGIIKSPRLIEARLRVAEEKGVLETVMDSYFLEYSYAFKMGDHLCEILDDENLGYHYSLTRFFVKNKGKLKGESRLILESSKQGEDMMFGEVRFGAARSGWLFGKLSLPVVGVDKKVCQLFQSGDSYERYQNPRIPCTSMHFTPVTSIVTLTGLESLSMGRYAGSRAASQYQQLGQQAFLHQTFNASMMQKLNTSDPKETSTASYILGACYSQSLACLNCASLSVASSFIWMKGLAGEIKPASQALASTLLEDKLTFYMHQITLYQPVIQTYLKQAESFLNLKVSRCWKVLLPSILTSVSSIALRIKLISNQFVKKFGSWLVRKSKVRKSWLTWMRERLMNCLTIVKILISELLKSGWCLAKIFSGLSVCLITRFIAGSCLVLELCRDVYQGKDLLMSLEVFLKSGVDLVVLRVISDLLSSAKKFCKVLGQMPVRMIIKLVENFWGEEGLEILEEVLEEMSAVKIIHDKIKIGVEQQLWTMIDPENLLKLTPGEGVELTQEQRTTKRSILNHYLDYLVGNVAVLGSSKDTQFPSFDLQIPIPRLTGFEWPVGLSPKIDLESFVKRVESWAEVSDDEWIKNSTRRQLFEPFAIHAMHFLQMDPDNHVTNIARKRAYQCKKAPEVAFDFCSGLPRRVINDARAQVISALNSSLFKTEGQKGVFEAKGFVEMNFDG